MMPLTEQSPLPDIEAILALHTVKRALVIGPLAVAIAWLVGGTNSAIGAAIGVVVIVLNLLASGAVLSMAARISLAAYHAAALFGFVLRLLTITVSMLLIARLFEIDRIAFGVTAVVTYLVLLILEAMAVARGDERELEWTS
ncbi:MAG: hypothetical protein IH941_00400 [Acidobacteria bacterium]|nr:hypothetical protein [Acidobacteriota bacterium]